MERQAENYEERAQTGGKIIRLDEIRGGEGSPRSDASRAVPRGRFQTRVIRTTVVVPAKMARKFQKRPRAALR